MMRVFLPTVLLTGLVSTTNAQDVMYEVTVLEPATGFTGTTVRAINDLGTYVGNSTGPNPKDPGALLARGLLDRPDALTQLAPLPGYVNSATNDLLRNQFAVGNSSDADFRPVPTYWLPSGTPRPLPLLDGHTTGNVQGANRQGLLVGASGDQPVLWRPNRRAYPLPVPAGQTGGTAFAVNDAGVIIGQAVSPAGAVAMVIRDGEASVFNSGIGLLTDINSSGLITGALVPGLITPLLYDVHTDALAVAPLPLGTFAGALNGLNDDGVAVGFALGAAIGAYITDGTTATDLNTLLDPVTGADITVFSAFDINDRGEIVANAATSAGSTVGVLLRPVAALRTPSPDSRRPGPRVMDTPATRRLLARRPDVQGF